MNLRAKWVIAVSVALSLLFGAFALGQNMNPPADKKVVVVVEKSVYSPEYETKYEVLTAEEGYNETVEVLSKLLYGEARGCSKTQQAAVIWTVINRAEGDYGKLLTEATAPRQFSGYSDSHPVLPELEEMVKDVLLRWELEKLGVGNVGRVLPEEYQWFNGDGKLNYFRNGYDGDYDTWDWSLPSPYND